MDTNDIYKFLENAKSVIRNIDKVLGWKDDSENELIQCPVNKNHLISPLSLEKHTQKCKWREWGYSKEEVNKIISDEDLLKPNKTINIDKFVSKLIPNAPPLRTDQAFKMYLNSEQRLKVYDFVCEKMQKNCDHDPSLYYNLHQAISKSEDDAKRQKSNVEIFKELRDFKRRRQSYRAKNVHITQRSHTEIIREVLNIHMDELRELWSTKISSTNSYTHHRSKSSNSTRHEKLSSRDLAPMSCDVQTSSRNRRSASKSRLHHCGSQSNLRSQSPKSRKVSRNPESSPKQRRDSTSQDRNRSPKRKRQKKEEREKSNDEKSHRHKKSHKHKHKKHKR